MSRRAISLSLSRSPKPKSQSPSTLRLPLPPSLPPKCARKDRRRRAICSRSGLWGRAASSGGGRGGGDGRRKEGRHDGAQSVPHSSSSPRSVGRSSFSNLEPAGEGSAADAGMPRRRRPLLRNPPDVGESKTVRRWRHRRRTVCLVSTRETGWGATLFDQQRRRAFSRN